MFGTGNGVSVWESERFEMDNRESCTAAQVGVPGVTEYS